MSPGNFFWAWDDMPIFRVLTIFAHFQFASGSQPEKPCESPGDPELPASV
jgi:hypothetical protein